MIFCAMSGVLSPLDLLSAGYEIKDRTTFEVVDQVCQFRWKAFRMSPCTHKPKEPYPGSYWQGKLVLVGVRRHAFYNLRVFCRKLKGQLHLVQWAWQGSDREEKSHDQRLKVFCSHTHPLLWNPVEPSAWRVPPLRFI